MNGEMGKIWKEAVVAQLKYCPYIFLEELRKNRKDLS
jgi:hypothetical protein